MIEELVGVHAAVREQGIVPPDDRAEDGENHVEERVNHPGDPEIRLHGTLLLEEDPFKERQRDEQGVI